jgi:hypothetical protein
MNNNGQLDIVNVGLWQVNRRKIDPDSLVPYMGKHIAWNGDASQVVAFGDSLEEVFTKLDQLGIRNELVVHEFLEDGVIL